MARVLIIEDQYKELPQAIRRFVYGKTFKEHDYIIPAIGIDSIHKSLEQEESLDAIIMMATGNHWRGVLEKMMPSEKMMTILLSPEFAGHEVVEEFKGVVYKALDSFDNKNFLQAFLRLTRFAA